LIIVDIPENLPIPNLSCPATSVPSWNTLRQGFLDHMFDFASAHVQDCGAILLFFPDDLDLKANLRGYMRTYGFALFREWMGISRLCMTSSRDRQGCHKGRFWKKITVWTSARVRVYPADAVLPADGFLPSADMVLPADGLLPSADAVRRPRGCDNASARTRKNKIKIK
jgi:hypothetical protein